MPRRHRDKSAGIFHVYAHGLWAVPALFREDRDRNEFLRHLAYAMAKTSSTCVAYCVMTSHYHLILQVDDGALPVAMHLVNRRYARYHNWTYALRGHAFFDRYGSRRIVDDLDLLDAFAYLARNPVKAGACERAADYPGSSYAAAIGAVDAASFVDPSLVLRAAERLTGDPVGALRRRVERSPSERPVPGTGL